MKVLVGYASAHGSTAEIADRLDERLRRHGLDVEVPDLGLVVDPARHDAFVLGSGPGDYSDWPAIERWGDGVGPVLAVMSPAG